MEAECRTRGAVRGAGIWGALSALGFFVVVTRACARRLASAWAMIWRAFSPGDGAGSLGFYEAGVTRAALARGITTRLRGGVHESEMRPCEMEKVGSRSRRVGDRRFKVRAFTGNIGRKMYNAGNAMKFMEVVPGAILSGVLLLSPILCAADEVAVPKSNPN